MNDEIMIFGHKNPDTDSVTSAIALSYLKNKLGQKTKPYRLGEISKETEYVLNYFDVPKPALLDNVKIQLKDLHYDRVEGLKPNESILTAYDHMNHNKIRTLPIIDEEDSLIGIVTMKDIAMSAIHGDFHRLHTTFENIKSNLNAQTLNYAHTSIDGHIIITAFHDKTIINEHIIGKHSVVITGDRYDLIDDAITHHAQLIIITGDMRIPDKLVGKAAVSGVNIIKTPYDTYYTSRVIGQTNTVGSIMQSDRLVKFKEHEYLDDCREIIQTSKHSKFPIIDENGKYLGIIGRTHLLNPGKKNVIIVDHNEYGQSADGLREANVLEIIDHHKLGDISTSLPISFRNMPVGSTNTILYQYYHENNIEIPKEIAGLMISGIISDTLFLKSPTATLFDEVAVKELSKIAEIEADKYAMAMFKSGTSLEGKSAKEIFYNDFKEFIQDGYKFGVSQVFTLNVDDILSDQTSYLDLILKINHDRDHFVTVMVITDIIKEGSYVLYASKNSSFLSMAFNQKVTQGTYIEGVVSRKKQIVPKFINAINILK